MDQTNKENQVGENYMLIAAIDLGTSLSGYAYANRKEPDENLEIIHKRCWNTTSKNRDIMKTATCVLFDDNKEFVAFGFTALEKFIDLQNKNSHREYMLFRDYKIQLYNCQQPLNTLMLTDMRGYSMLAKEIFTASIEAIKNDLLKSIATAGQAANVNEIRWVLTVPAIWSEDAKNFMRQCAEKAGLPGDHLILALEPEAASIYCQHLEVERPKSSRGGFKALETGTKFVVVDMGGGTTDITLHVKKDRFELEEIAPACGKDIGGITLDRAFFKMFEDIVGEKLLHRLQRSYLEAYIDLFRNIEDMKKSITPETTGQIRVSVPCNTICKIMENLQGYSSSTLENEIKRNSKLKPGMNAQLVNDKISIEAKYVLDIFKQNIRPIINILKEVIESNGKIALIVLAGGMSDNELLQDIIKRYFDPIRVVVAEPASLAVLKGAVLYGRNPKIINPRKTRYTYGFNSCSKFNESTHDIKRKFCSDFTEILCRNIFSIIVKKNDSVRQEDIKTKTFSTILRNQTSISWTLYSAETDNPVYVDDPGCKIIGEFTFDIPFPSEEERSVAVECMFGDTELKINVTDDKYRTTFATKLILPTYAVT